jgi:exopolyphosphatase / guanosine-5'-triphosphate,3'-diphosphate pyrophosphatase
VTGRETVEEVPGPVAAVDCGTNSTRLLIVAGDSTVLERQMRITRLGEGVDATHSLSRDAMARTVSVLVDYRELMDHHGVVRARMVATSAARDAVNAEEFLSAALEATGVRPEVLSGLEEGALSFAGATAHVPDTRLGPGPVLVVDIGGGSTELAVGERAPANSPTSVVSAVSLDVGCVRVTERFFGHDPPRPDELAAARRVVDAQLAVGRDALPPLARDGVCIGLAGTVSTLAQLDRRVAHYVRDEVHHSVLTRRAVTNWLETLAGEDRHARLARPGMIEGRADVIVGGVLVLDAVMSAFDRAECLVSEDDILDGLVASLHPRT